MRHIIRYLALVKRSLTPVFGLALLLALIAGSLFGSNKASNKIEVMARAGSAKADTMGKADPEKTDAMVKAGIPPSPDKPDKVDGNELAMSCKAEVQGFDAGYCLGVVEGVMASMRVCKQDHTAITLGEAADAMEKYLASHPDKLNERDVVLARKALSKAYPCGPFRQ